MRAEGVCAQGCFIAGYGDIVGASLLAIGAAVGAIDGEAN
jgi:hypothetical protein